MPGPPRSNHDSPTLLTLPVEIRNKIYYYLFQNVKVFYSRPSEVKEEMGLLMDFNTPQIVSTAPATLLACHQTHNEAHDLFYDMITAVFQESDVVIFANQHGQAPGCGLPPAARHLGIRVLKNVIIKNCQRGGCSNLLICLPQLQSLKFYFDVCQVDALDFEQNGHHLHLYNVLDIVTDTDLGHVPADLAVGGIDALLRLSNEVHTSDLQKIAAGDRKSLAFNIEVHLNLTQAWYRYRNQRYAMQTILPSWTGSSQQPSIILLSEVDIVSCLSHAIWLNLTASRMPYGMSRQTFGSSNSRTRPEISRLLAQWLKSGIYQIENYPSRILLR